MNGNIHSPFGTISYFNTDDIKLVQSAVSRMYRMADERKDFKSSKVAAIDSIEKGFNTAKDAKQGLFYFSLDFEQVYAKSFSIGTSQVDFGYHRDYFAELVNAGILSGSDYEAYPRGFTVYDGLSQLYMIVSGSWLSDVSATKLCDSLNFDVFRFPYAIVPNPAYDYQNNGVNAGKPYSFTKGRL
jgi:hypothetical protein